MSIRSSFPTDSPSLVLDFANSRRLDPRITFTRAQTGNISSYMGRDGLIKYAGPDEPRFDHRAIVRTNLVTYSENFSSWGVNRLSVSNNIISSPFGGVTADKLVEDTTASNTHRISSDAISFISGQTYTHSVYVKAGERTAIAVEFHFQNSGSIWGNAPRARFNVINGAIGDYNDCTPSITYVGDGWWRCSITATATSSGTNQPGYKLCTSTVAGSEVYDGDGVSGLYVWGAQIEVGNVATEYIQTNSTAVTDTKIESLGLLVEESRTNEIPYSQTFNTWWSSSNATLTANSAISPDGTQTAYTIQDNSTNGFHTVQKGLGILTGNYTISFYVKVKELSKGYLQLLNTGGTENAAIFFDLNTSSPTNIVGDHGSVTKVGNGWHRISVGRNFSSGNPVSFYFVLLNNAGQGTYSGNGDGMYIWGAQLEAGAFPTSYIPTNGATVTRSRDDVQVLGSKFNFYNSSEGSITLKYRIVGSNTDNTIIALNNSTQNEQIDSRWFGTGTGYRIRVGGVNQASYAEGDIPPIIDKEYMSSFGYQTNNSIMAINGTLSVGDYSGSMPSGVDRLQIGQRAGSSYGNLLLNKMSYYPLRLSNAQLQELTK